MVLENIRNIRKEHDKKQQEPADYQDISADYLLKRPKGKSQRPLLRLLIAVLPGNIGLPYRDFLLPRNWQEPGGSPHFRRR